jgi:hypothetical protein
LRRKETMYDDEWFCNWCKKDFDKLISLTENVSLICVNCLKNIFTDNHLKYYYESIVKLNENVDNYTIIKITIGFDEAEYIKLQIFPYCEKKNLI